MGLFERWYRKQTPPGGLSPLARARDRFLAAISPRPRRFADAEDLDFRHEYRAAQALYTDLMQAAREAPLTPDQVQDILFRQHFVRVPGTVEPGYRANEMAGVYSRQPVVWIFKDLIERAVDEDLKLDLADMLNRIWSILPPRRFDEPPRSAHRIPYPKASEEVTERLRPQPLGPEDAEAVAPAAKATLDDSLARLFIRLGPPPEPTHLDYTPAGRGGGGATQ
ncbi:hypothetical protein ABZ485_28065 [Streptomyces albogriseolus]|uniref:hypothetical protein n=1 Tax=Streptomyces albogriseolus TaxID=1887 RepID=UPI0034614018